MKNTRHFRPLLADLGFIGASSLLLLLAQQALRLILLLRNPELAEGASTTDLVWAFAVGIRFDLIITSYILIPVVLALLLPNGLGKRRLARYWLLATGGIVLFLGISEPEFYHDFHTRLNSLAIQYLKEDPSTVSSMIWHGFPVIRYLLLWAVLLALLAWGLKQADHWTRRFGPGYPAWWVRIPVFLICAFLVALGARGTLRHGAPLRWGDAFHSQNLFANHLALNGTWSLAKAAMGNDKKDAGKAWVKIMPREQALAGTRKLLLTPDDQLLLPEQYPVLRKHAGESRLARKPKNLVLIIMESFSGQFTGALGNDHGITPRFDELAKDGLLFDHMFSNGTHTHQGMFATVACFPNLPGFEYLMQEPEGQHQFSGLPALLKPLGFQDVYVYNGAFNWDNQKGFFRNQGMTRFIGRDQMENPVFTDPTWGVSDQDMFDQALRELNRMNQEKPFFAVLQTLSNHTPYALPDPLPVSRVTGFDGLNEHLTAMRYADWALGRFFDEAKKQPWYQDTLFVLLGDHGFGVKKQLGQIDLLRFHIPMLMLAPGIQERFGKRIHTAATQVDVIPTAVNLLLGKPFTHQCWGRDLLSLSADDPGLGIIKPSGSDHTVAHFRGNRIVIKPPHGKAVTGRYQLYPEPSFTPDENMTERTQMLSDLKAYVSTAMHALLENRTGLPPTSHTGQSR
ncbi:LTA synthase family protein [Thiolapillus brandeum]|nr:LTA synthase family protein [Thiolapillus brandeum]